MKVCTKCKEEKSLEAFSGTQKEDGTKRYNSHCKACISTQTRAKRRAQGMSSRAEWLASVSKPKMSPEETRELGKVKWNLGKVKWNKWNEQHGERIRLESREAAKRNRQALLDSGVKRCSGCGDEKPLHRFHTRNRKRKDGSSYEVPYSHCKDCRRTTNRLHEKTPKAKADKRIRQALYSERSKNATPKWLTPEQKQEIVAIYEHMRDCRAVTGEEYHVDHIVPLKGEHVCGLHVPWNLQVLPAYINIAKSNIFMD